jgi:hypothetical protein
MCWVYGAECPRERTGRRAGVLLLAERENEQERARRAIETGVGRQDWVFCCFLDFFVAFLKLCGLRETGGVEKLWDVVGGGVWGSLQQSSGRAL